jgi:hypothetical protein
MTEGDEVEPSAQRMTDPGATDPRIIDAWRVPHLANALNDLPQTYPEIRFQLMAISDEFHRQCAKALEPLVNQFVQHKRPKTLEECRTVARVIDDAVRQLGLCVAVDGKPGVPCATIHETPTGRKGGFAILTLPEGRGTRPVKNKLDPEHPWFSLIPASLATSELKLHPLRETAWRVGGRD